MKKIQNKTNSIVIVSNGININGTADCQISGLIVDLESALSSIDILKCKTLTFDGASFRYGENIQINNFNTLMQQFLCENTDVGKNADEIYKDFGVALIWADNSLNLNIEDWQIE